MPFKITSKKSWGNTSSKQLDNAFSKKARVRNDENWNDFTSTVRDDTQKTVKSVAKGVGRELDDLNSFWLYLGIGGIAVFGGFIIFQEL